MPPGFHLTLPVRPLAPSVGLCPHGPSFTRSITPSFFVASLLSPAPGASLFLPASSATVPPFPYFPSVSAPSATIFVSWSLPMVPTCSAPSLSSLASHVPSWVLQVFSLGPTAPPPPSSLLLSAPALPSSQAALISSFGLSGPPGFAIPASSACVDPDAGTSSSVPLSTSVGSGLVAAGAAGASDLDDAFLYHAFDEGREGGVRVW